MPLHHCLGFPNMILEGGSFDPHDPPLDPPLLTYYSLHDNRKITEKLFAKARKECNTLSNS